MILHITSRGEWQQALEQGAYTHASLTTEGFIHCSTPEQVTQVADERFRGESGLILLCIDSSLVAPEIRYEGEIEQYPHIYGPLNLNAVVSLVEFPPNADGTFALPLGVDASRRPS